jgi:hypothetical protein
MTATKLARALGLLAATVAVSAGIAACGGGGGGDDQAKVEGTVHDLYNGFADKDEGKICDSISDAQKKKLTSRPGPSGKKQSCEDVMKLVVGLAGNQLKDVGNSKVTDVKIDGEKATATVSFKGRKGKVGLAKQGDDWKIDDFNAGKL